MVLFLTTDTYRQISKLLRSSRRSIVAVPFWGQNSVSSLRLSTLKNKEITVICNLNSGACNPGEIAKLRKLKFSVLTHDDLHAKLYWSPEAAIVGSSNVSANGLGFEGAEIGGNIEANVLVRDAQMVTNIRNWLQKDVLPHCDKVTQGMLDEAQLVWKARRMSRDRLVTFRRSRSFWDQVKNDASFFKDKRIFLWTYDDHYSDETKERVRTKQREFGDKDIEAWELEPDDEAEPDDVIVDVFCGNRDKPQCCGLYKISGDLGPIRLNDHTVYFCRKIKRFDGLSFANSDRRAVERFVAKNFASVRRKADKGLDLWNITHKCKL